MYRFAELVSKDLLHLPTTALAHSVDAAMSAVTPLGSLKFKGDQKTPTVQEAHGRGGWSCGLIAGGSNRASLSPLRNAGLGAISA
jgi:hypothetical protein